MCVVESFPFFQKVLQCFLGDGIPLSKVTGLRDLLEEHAYRLTSRGHLLEYIPIVRDKECNTVLREIRGRQVGLIFDGTTHLGEAIAVVCGLWTTGETFVRS